MGDQQFIFWFTDWPSTHVNAGRTVEVVPRAEFERLREALRRAHEQLGKHDYKGPKQIGRAMLTMEQALGIASPPLSDEQSYGEHFAEAVQQIRALPPEDRSAVSNRPGAVPPSSEKRA